MPGLLSRIASRFKFGYDATLAKGKRRPPTSIVRDEDSEASPTDRGKLVASARDQQRNFSIARWMVQRHLDYVSDHTFQSRSGDKEVDRIHESLMAGWGGRRTCEVTGRHRLSKLLRLAEARRTLDGDVFIMRLADGRLQAIEGDRIKTPSGGLPANINAKDLVHGVKLDAYGAPEAYAVCRREQASLKFERMVSAENTFHHFYIDRFDQCRGISPMTSAINGLQDCYEALDHAVNKVKVEQYFALLLLSDSAQSIGTTSSDEDGQTRVNIGKNPSILTLNRGDDAKFLQSNSPSTATQAFFQVLIQVALKALDIPYSFYSEDFTNYSGARQALMQYETSVKSKRQDNIELLDWITTWKTNEWIEAGLLPADLPPHSWTWIPGAIGWIDPVKEILAKKEAIALRTTSRTRTCREEGVDFLDLLDEIAAEEQAMRDRGILFETPKSDPTLLKLALEEDRQPKKGNKANEVSDGQDPANTEGA